MGWSCGCAGAARQSGLVARGGAQGPHRDHRQRTHGGHTGGHLLEKLVIGGFGGVM